MAQNTKLELTWIGKYDEKPNVEPRILIENPHYSYGSVETGVLPNGKPWNGNMLIHGDNLLALKALESNFSNAVKCIYIDPPFNTGQAFENYDDNLEHTIWLQLMSQRFRILYKLLQPNGMFWIHLDDVEVHYCKVLLDEIFMRHNFVSHITYERSAVAGLGQGGYLVNTTEHILLYKKGALPNKNNISYEELGLNIIRRYNRFISDFGERVLVREFKAKSNGEEVRIYKHSGFRIDSISLRDADERKCEIKQLLLNHLKTLFRGNRVQRENEFQNDIISQLDKEGLYSMEYIPSRGKNEGEKTTLYYYNQELLSWLKDTTIVFDGNLSKGTKMTTLWKHNEIPKADIANEGGVFFPRGKKPEQLLRRIIEMSTDPGDIVLDSFLGSGTTAAVAHKMGRKWIGIEFGEQAYTHCNPRLHAVIDNKDQLGITKSVDWQGGGGFKFYELAPSLLKKDSHGHLVINKEYNADMLAAAMAKMEGFTYEPSTDIFWKQGHSSETDFIYTTTQFVTVESLGAILDTMADGESLLVCCKAFQPECKNFSSRISVKKIPSVLLGRCEFDHDDYSLNIIELPQTEEIDDSEDLYNSPEAFSDDTSSEPSLF